MHYVYKHYDNLDNLIYVGETKNPDMRRYNHRSNSYWMSMSVREEIEEFNSKDAALDYEKFIIQEKQPLFNRMHNIRKFFLLRAYMWDKQVNPLMMLTKKSNKLFKYPKKERLYITDIMSLACQYVIENENDFLSWMEDDK